MRFTGYDSEDIQISQDTEGISSEVGPLGLDCLSRADKFAAMIAEGGFYAVTEEDAILISQRIRSSFLDLDADALDASIVRYLSQDRTLWFAVPGASDGGVNKTVYVYHIDLGIWLGPWTYPHAITCMTQWTDSVGQEYMVAGCSDGYVRALNYATSKYDNLDYAGANGTLLSPSPSVDLSPVFFSGPGSDKTLSRITLHGKLPSGRIDVYVDVDEEGWELVGHTHEYNGSAKPYRVDAWLQGDRHDIRLKWTDPSIEIQGLTIEGFATMRPGE